MFTFHSKRKAIMIIESILNGVFHEHIILSDA